MREERWGFSSASAAFHREQLILKILIGVCLLVLVGSLSALAYLLHKQRRDTEGASHVLDPALNAQHKGRTLNLLSFASPGLSRRRGDFLRDAQALGIFDQVVVAEEEMLPRATRDFALSRRAGFGHWTWKPILIQRALSDLRDGTEDARKELEEWLQLLEESPAEVIGFQLNSPEKSFTKQDVFAHFGVNASSPHYHSGQLAGGIHLWRAGRRSRAVASQWAQLALHHSDLFSSEPSSSAPEGPHFQATRNDQSVFSLLAKIFNATILPDVSWPPSQDHFVSASRLKY